MYLSVDLIYDLSWSLYNFNTSVKRSGLNLPLLLRNKQDASSMLCGPSTINKQWTSVKQMRVKYYHRSHWFDGALTCLSELQQSMAGISFFFKANKRFIGKWWLIKTAC